MISRIGSPRYAVSGPSGQEKPTLDAGSSRWYIAECKPTRERTLRSSLEKVGYEAYVASRKEIHVYKSRNRRTVEQIVIPGKVFVRTERANLMNILLLFSSVYRFQIDKSAASPTSGEPPYAYVTESEMRRLQHLLVESANPVYITPEPLRLEEKVIVRRGPLSGTEGWLYRKPPTTYVAVPLSTSTSRYAYTEVSANDLRILR